eukprot:TRINITY_DN24360_c1_g1_i1.p1 TRINITY_DN24360_c1_g1~~TRINITY_DN24360_c1_g1_i1.p1  ORF type:complete len:845 (+),score=180.85 TRINITY_DN24360_c1_g1_i1:337-2535(+)
MGVAGASSDGEAMGLGGAARFGSGAAAGMPASGFAASGPGRTPAVGAMVLPRGNGGMPVGGGEDGAGALYAQYAAGNYAQLSAAGEEGVGGSSVEVLAAAPAQPAFDREALMRLAKQAAEEAEENEASVEAVALAPAPQAPAASSGGSAALAKAASASGPAAVPDTAPRAEEANSATAGSASASAAAAAALAFRAPAPQAPKKDTFGVLGILRAAQDNVARNRSGDARGGAPGTQGAKEGDTGAANGENGESSAPSDAVVAQLDSVNRRLEAVVTSSSSSSSECRRAAEKEVLAVLPNLDPAWAIDLVVRTHSVEGLRGGKGFLTSVARALIPTIPRFTSPHLTRLTGTLASWAQQNSAGATEENGRPRLSQDLLDFFGAVQKEAGLRLMDIPPGDVGRIAVALASLGLTNDELFGSFAKTAVARSDRFSPHDLVSLAGAFDKARIFHLGLFELLTKTLRSSIKEVAPRDVLRAMRALCSAGLRDEELGQAIGAHLPRKATTGGLSVEEFCNLGWTFCALDLHHTQLFRAVFRALEDSAVVASETLCQLYEIHLTLTAFHHDTYKAYELEDGTVQSLREHYAEERGLAGRKELEQLESAGVLKEVSDMLQEVLDVNVLTSHRTAQGLSVDLAATRKRSSGAEASPLVVVDFDGPHTLVRSLPCQDGSASASKARLRGGVALRRRLLRKSGEKVAVVNEDTWRLLQGRRAKEEHLRAALHEAGLGMERSRRSR